MSTDNNRKVLLPSDGYEKLKSFIEWVKNMLHARLDDQKTNDRKKIL